MPRGELFPRLGFIVTSFSLPSRAVVRFYNRRGTAKRWIEAGKQATHWTRLLCHRFQAIAVRLHAFSVFAFAQQRKEGKVRGRSPDIYRSAITDKTDARRRLLFDTCVSLDGVVTPQPGRGLIGMAIVAAGLTPNRCLGVSALDQEGLARDFPALNISGNFSDVASIIPS
jgi:hypothetical protein